MKSHRARILALQAIYQLQYNERDLKQLMTFDWIDYEIPEQEKAFAQKLIKGVLEYTEIIDKIIEKYSQNWKIERISPVSKTILRISIYQMKYHLNEIPHKVVIDEALKLSKKFGEDDSGRFVNGILDTYYHQEIENQA